MKHVNLKLLGTVVLLSATLSSFSQNNWTINGNGNTTGATNFLGTTNNEPINFRTNNTQRMIIQDGTAPTAGYVGIGTNFNTPLFPLHVQADPNNTITNSWSPAILMSNEAALMWQAAPSASGNFFMGFPSNTPLGDFWCGMTTTSSI